MHTLFDLAQSQQGRVSIDRGGELAEMFMSFLRRNGLDSHGYPDDNAAGRRTQQRLFWDEGQRCWHNDVFLIRRDSEDPYCSCGLESEVTAWEEARPHADDCYLNLIDRRTQEIASRFGVESFHEIETPQMQAARREVEQARRVLHDRYEAAMQDSDKRPAWLEAIAALKAAEADEQQARSVIQRCDEELHAYMEEQCARLSLTYPTGCMVHCSCGADAALEAAFAGRLHTPECHAIEPQFCHKPSGLKIYWYKYALRSAKLSQRTTRKQLRLILRECSASLQTK